MKFLLFFIIVFVIYYVFLKERTKLQNFFLLFVSYFFYGFAEPKMLLLLIGATLAFYYLGIGITNAQKIGEKKRASTLTTIGIALGVLSLLYFRYLNFFITSFSDFFELFGLHTNLHTFNILLPLGISFITFRLISYVIEINRGTIEATRNIITFSTYIAFFPCLLSGPIDRPQTFIPQLVKKRSFDYNLTINGLEQILWGLFKKVLVADNLAMIVNNIWSNSTNLSGSTLIWGAILYSFQIYADFSGYSDMAIGVAKILGFDVAKNFNYPYFSRNISEFWSRWHMSFTNWLRDYLYIPLGGNRCAKARQFYNTMVVFSLCGLWHGANWTFVLWGIYNGLLFLPLILKGKNKYPKVIAEGKMLPNLKETINMFGTFILITFGWILFRSDNIGQAYEYITQIFNASLFTLPSEGRSALLYVPIMVLAEWLQRHQEFPLQLSKTLKSPIIKWGVYYIIILTIILFAGQKSQFIYYQF